MHSIKLGQLSKQKLRYSEPYQAKDWVAALMPSYVSAPARSIQNQFYPILKIFFKLKSIGKEFRWTLDGHCDRKYRGPIQFFLKFPITNINLIRHGF